jgi:hypothetical protein
MKALHAQARHDAEAAGDCLAALWHEGASPVPSVRAAVGSRLLGEIAIAVLDIRDALVTNG